MQSSEAFCQFDLARARKSASTIGAAPHQQSALQKLTDWMKSSNEKKGGILVLPTGGGKTFTAVRFLCREPLSQGYKVLWLAHTHHLLDQAYATFAPQDEATIARRGLEVGLIAAPRATLDVRVISGTPSHLPVHTVRASDDVVISTLQTMTKAHNHLSGLRGLKAWLKSAEKLVVVFDEAHHSPAPSFRRLLESLRKSHPQMLLLGLTATPTYGDERQQGWLEELFPQGILYQADAKKLMLDGILAKPIFESVETHFDPEFTGLERKKWEGESKDLPDYVVDQLASNAKRNELIAETYKTHQQKFGKTIIFAERWWQCVQICEFLEPRGVKAGTMFSHVEAQKGKTPEERNAIKREPNANAKALEKFRKGELDVLVNIRMLTEGTDVPDVQTAFLTRQTTSRILLTQMIGRALRGPKFGGTDEAYLVLFKDDWNPLPQFADWEWGGGEQGPVEEKLAGKRMVQLISIELVKKLARLMDSGQVVADKPFLETLPLGFYLTTFDNEIDLDNTETARELVLVYDHDQQAFESFITQLKTRNLDEFASVDVKAESLGSELENWVETYFPTLALSEVATRGRGLLNIARHMAQKQGLKGDPTPRFVLFEERKNHDMDELAREAIRRKLDLTSVQQFLQREFEHSDRLWRVLFPNFLMFKTQFDACLNRILMGETPVEIEPGTIAVTEIGMMSEPSDEVKKQVKDRDGHKCLCCGETRRLEIDHIVARYFGGGNELSNLQTLCKSCNQNAGIAELNFRLHRNVARQSAPVEMRWFELPDPSKVKDASAWEKYLRRHINFFYECGAVHSVKIGGRGTGFYEWEIELWDGNEPQWLKGHLKNLRDEIRQHIQDYRGDGFVMERLIVTAPNAKTLASPEKSAR